MTDMAQNTKSLVNLYLYVLIENKIGNTRCTPPMIHKKIVDTAIQTHDSRVSNGIGNFSENVHLKQEQVQFIL